jgi:excisionase family DNA binding protein
MGAHVTVELTLQQLCATLSVSESTVRRWVADGLPYTPIGRRSKRFNLEETRLWLREHQACPSGSTKTAAATSGLWSAAREFTESSRKVHLRVMPSNLRAS